MKFNLNELQDTLEEIQTTSSNLDRDDKIRTYGTFLDSKKEMIQLYILFIFFGINHDVIQQLPKVGDHRSEYPRGEYPRSEYPRSDYSVD